MPSARARVDSAARGAPAGGTRESRSIRPGELAHNPPAKQSGTTTTHPSAIPTGTPLASPASAARPAIAAKSPSAPHWSVLNPSTRRAASCAVQPALWSAHQSTASPPGTDAATTAPKPIPTIRVTVHSPRRGPPAMAATSR
jgi:hypothetical protein